MIPVMQNSMVDEISNLNCGYKGIETHPAFYCVFVLDAIIRGKKEYLIDNWKRW